MTIQTNATIQPPAADTAARAQEIRRRLPGQARRQRLDTARLEYGPYRAQFVGRQTEDGLDTLPTRAAEADRSTLIADIPFPAPGLNAIAVAERPATASATSKHVA